MSDTLSISDLHVSVAGKPILGGESGRSAGAKSTP